MTDKALHPDIAKYQDDPIYAYLNKEVVILPGKPPHVPQRAILVMEACGLLSFRLGNINASLKFRESDEGSLPLEMIYAPLAACSFGDVPTPDEFLAMPGADIDVWLKKAREINPEFFASLDEAAKVAKKLTEELAKKKEKKRRRSAHGLAVSS